MAEAQSHAFPHFTIASEPLFVLPVTVSTDCLRHKNELHFHNYTQICHVLSGTLKHTIGDSTYLQTPGSSVIILPYTQHQIDTTESDDTPVATFVCFSDTFLTDRGYRFFSYSNEHARFEERSIPYFSKLNGENKEAANNLVREMSSEFSREKNMSFDRIAELLASYLRILCIDTVADNDIVLIKERADAITASINYIAKHYSEKITIEDLCSVAAMSRCLYTKNFKMITGMTVAQFLLSARLRRAGTLLTFTDKPLNEIAIEVGLYDKSRLSHAFTDYFGISPSQFRTQMRLDETMMEADVSFRKRWKWLDIKQSN